LPLGPCKPLPTTACRRRRGGSRLRFRWCLAFATELGLCRLLVQQFYRKATPHTDFLKISRRPPVTCRSNLSPFDAISEAAKAATRRKEEWMCEVPYPTEKTSRGTLLNP